MRHASQTQDARAVRRGTRATCHVPRATWEMGPQLAHALRPHPHERALGATWASGAAVGGGHGPFGV